MYKMPTTLSNLIILFINENIDFVSLSLIFMYNP